MCVLSDDSEKMKLNVKLKLNTMSTKNTKSTNYQTYLHLGLVENEISFYQENITLAQEENANATILNGMNRRLYNAKRRKLTILNILGHGRGYAEQFKNNN